MKAGFIGAGKVGFSLGRYLKENGTDISGYYSRNPESAAEAARFTGSRHYETMAEVTGDSRILFLTVPDGQIGAVWEKLREMPIKEKCIVHCSGSLTSAVFSEIDRCGAYGYSIHPLFAIHDKEHSYKELSKAFFTIEGNERFLGELTGLLEACGNPVQVISAADKLKYHGAASVASNLMVGLAEISVEMLTECGFSKEGALRAMKPLMLGNMQNIVNSGPMQALTGPVERGDALTVEKHLSVLDGDRQEIYRLLSKEILKLAQEKNPERDYGMVKEILGK